MKRFLLICAVGLFSTPLLASGWTVDDLGTLGERAECMKHAEATMKQYYQDYGGVENIATGEWTVGGYGLRGNVVDGLIICPIKAGMAAPFMIVHNSDDDSEARVIVGERLREIWDTKN